MRRPYSGIRPVAPTPFDDDGALDLDGMRRATMLREGGVIASDHVSHPTRPLHRSV